MKDGTFCVQLIMVWFTTLVNGSLVKLQMGKVPSLSFVGQRLSRKRKLSIHSSKVWMMPEGPEVRTTIGQLQAGVGRRLIDIRFLSGRYVKHGRPPGFESFATTMSPVFEPHLPTPVPVDIVEEIACKGKFIYMKLDTGSNPPSSVEGYQRSIWITLGMSGRFVPEKRHREDPRFARWCLEFKDLRTGSVSRVFYHDQRNFGTLKFCQSEEELEQKLASLGPDILDPATNEEKYLEIINKQRDSLNVCKFLMDQSKLSGIGNYILSECLYRASIDPFASLGELSEKQKISLFREARAVANESYISQNDRETTLFKLQCYGRDTCARGDQVIRESNGPHKRTIWYTQRQLLMPLADRLVFLSSDSPAKKDDALRETQAGTWDGFSGEDLDSGLTDRSWRDALSHAVESESFKRLSTFLGEEISNGATVYPRRDEVFASLNLCPLESVKVVIVGQDPYHGAGQGHGLAFSVRKGVASPPSLKNVIKEAIDDCMIEEPEHGNLESWARQGVLLLNSVLTVRRGEPASHKGQGWEEFTDTIISVLNEKDDGLVFLLWGNPAATKAKQIDEERHVVIRTSHPSPLGARKTKSPFLGSRCFSRANAALSRLGKDEIDWSIN